MAKPPQVSKFGPLAAFDPEAFRKLIQGRGLWYRWSRAMTCSCRLGTQTDQWDPTCARCGGDGWLYVNPCAATERHLTRDFMRTRCVFSTVMDRPSVHEEAGSWPFGSATLTVQNELRVGYRDRFIGTQQEMAWSELVERGADLVPVGRNGLTATLQRTAMRYEPIRINYVEKDDGAGSAVIYYEGTDFTIVPGFGDGINQMQWITGMGPAAGELYSIHYDIHPVWVVDEGVYRIQNSIGPEAGLSGQDVLQHLPTTFKMILDFLTPERSA